MTQKIISLLFLCIFLVLAHAPALTMELAPAAKNTKRARSQRTETDDLLAGVLTDDVTQASIAFPTAPLPPLLPEIEEFFQPEPPTLDQKLAQDITLRATNIANTLWDAIDEAAVQAGSDPCTSPHRLSAYYNFVQEAVETLEFVYRITKNLDTAEMTTKKALTTCVEERLKLVSQLESQRKRARIR